jgi:hypothetical protein
MCRSIGAGLAADGANGGGAAFGPAACRVS